MVQLDWDIVGHCPHHYSPHIAVESISTPAALYSGSLASKLDPCIGYPYFLQLKVGHVFLIIPIYHSETTIPFDTI